MQFFPLLDREGQVRAWADRKTGWISDINGSVFAVTEFDGVFTAQAYGEQIGWFCGDHLRDRLGRVVLARPGARIEGIIMPRAQDPSGAAQGACAYRPSAAEMVVA